MARPKKSPDERRDSRTVILLTEQERASVEQQAQAYGLTVSDFMRRRALGHRLPELCDSDRIRDKLATSLLRLGVNLNQIAKHMNAGRSAPMHLPHLIADIRATTDRVMAYESRRDRYG